MIFFYNWIKWTCRHFVSEFKWVPGLYSVSEWISIFIMDMISSVYCLSFCLSLQKWKYILWIHVYLIHSFTWEFSVAFWVFGIWLIIMNYTRGQPRMTRQEISPLEMCTGSKSMTRHNQSLSENRLGCGRNKVNPVIVVCHGNLFEVLVNSVLYTVLICLVGHPPFLI